MICAAAFPFFCVFRLLPFPSVFRDERARAGSGKFDKAGVDGLLALPLLVVTIAFCDAGGRDSLLRSGSSMLVSFLPLLGV